MSLPRTLLSTLALAFICLLPTSAADASTSGAHHKKHNVCRTARHHKKHHRRCQVKAHKNTKARKSLDTHAASANGTITPSASTLALSSLQDADAASIARVLAATCQNTQITPTAENLQLIREATLCLVNQERARNNELPLKVDSQLEQTAQGHSERMVSENYFEHVSPSGETPVQRFQAAGYIPNDEVGYAVGENIAWGTLNLTTPQAIVEAWIASPEHLENILEAKYQDTAIGIAAQAPAYLSEGQPGATYTQDFGVIEH